MNSATTMRRVVAVLELCATRVDKVRDIDKSGKASGRRTEYDGGMNEKRPPVGRATLGGIAGALIGPVAGVFVLSFLRGHEPLTPDEGIRFLIASASVGACLGAIFGVTVGSRDIRGRASSTVQGLLYGAIAGILMGYFLGSLGGKFGVVHGIVFGGMVGAILGGYLGAELHPKSKAGESSTKQGGVRDRELDGP